MKNRDMGRVNPHPDRKKWNEKYTRNGPQTFGMDPSNWLVTHEGLFLEQPKGRALDVACGNGRNSFFLAGLGFDVDAIDISDVVIEWLQGETAKRKLPVKPRRCDIETCELPSDTYQVIISFNFLERGIFPALREALAPGGLLIFETLTQDHVDVLKRKFNRKVALKKDELRHSFPELKTISYREEIVADRGSEAAVASLVARKP